MTLETVAAEFREPAGYDWPPVHRSESPTGYSSAGCSPAEPASASPVPDIVAHYRSVDPIQPRRSTAPFLVSLHGRRPGPGNILG
jgi:hypothetical protein